jgi:hypothetical protein
MFDDYLPKVDFEQFARLAMDTDGSRVLWTGVGAVTLGFFIRLAISAYHKERGKPFDYLTPIAFAVFWLVVGLGYAAISNTIIQFVTSLGLLQNSGDALTEVFARRYAGFMAHQAMHDTSLPQMLTATGWKVASMELLVHLCWVATLCAIFFVKGAQVFVLQTIVMFGPILLGLASIGPFFHVLAVSWFWALFEVSAWSISIGVVLHSLDTFTRMLPDQFSWMSEVMISLFAVVMVWGVTKFTAMLVRGESGGNLGRDFMHSIYGMARLTQGTAQTAGAVLGPLGGSATGDLGLRTATAAMRGFGNFVGRTLRESGKAMNSSFDAPRAENGGSQAAASGNGGSGAAATARRKQQDKHFAIQAKMKKRTPRGDG